MGDSYLAYKQNNLYTLSESSTSSRQLSSPRTIEDLLRQKYTSTLSKENSVSLSIPSPAAHLEHVLANSRFTKRSAEPNATPRFMPRQAQVSIKELEKALQDRDAPRRAPEKPAQVSYPQKATPRQQDPQKPLDNRQSLEIIQKLRQEVRNRSHFMEPEEPPDILEMNVLERNSYWLQAKMQKIESQRKAKQDKELDGCTFKPTLNTQRLRIPVSMRSKSPNASYTNQYARKKNFRSNSTGKLSARSTPRAVSRDEIYMSPFANYQISPSSRNVAYKAGINVNSFLSRAQPVVDYRYFK